MWSAPLTTTIFRLRITPSMASTPFLRGSWSPTMARTGSALRSSCSLGTASLIIPRMHAASVTDTLGAGLGEMVLICQGSSARLTPETEKLPIDAVVIGLVDTVDVGGRVAFSTRDESRAG